MKLLMITRKVDRADALAGFAYGWVRKIGLNVDQLFVLCLGKGDISGLPANIKIFSLGKEKNNSRFGRFLNFQILALKLVPQVDGIFCHMNPEYTIAIAPCAKLFGKKIVAWYTHGKAASKLKLLEKLANTILTASKESFRLPSKKLIITGHGIDTDLFRPGERKGDGIFKIVTVGRISPTKDYESMIKAISLLTEEGIKNINLDIIGQAGLSGQEIYFENLRQMAQKMKLENQVKFLGSIPNTEIQDYLRPADLFINLSGTGSLDKAVLEAMACGGLVLTSNEAFVEILPADLMVRKDQPKELAEKIKWLMALPADEVNQLRRQLREEVVKNHNLDNLVKKIISQFEK